MGKSEPDHYVANDRPKILPITVMTAIGGLPSLSFVLPVRNEAAFIKECLEAVRAQDYPSDRIEILVVDGCSDDGTQEILAALAKTEPRLKVLQNPARIVPAAMNLGIKAAKSDIIIRVDGHAVIPPDYARRCVDCLLAQKVECVGGAVDSVGTNYVGAAIALAMSSPFGVGGSSFRTSGKQNTVVPVETVPFGAFRGDVFRRVGLFNEEMVRHQDYEFNYRLRQSGGKILLIPSLRVKYYVRSSLKSLWRQYWGYGIWKGRFLRSYPRSVRIRHMVPPAFVLSLVGSALLALFTKAGLWFGAALLASYGLFLLLAALNCPIRSERRLAPVMPIIFSILHVSWGTAVWTGLFLGPLSTRSTSGQDDLQCLRSAE